MAADTLKVSRKGDSLTTGHICSATTTLATPGQDTVYANGIRIARRGDSTVQPPFPPPRSGPLKPEKSVKSERQVDFEQTKSAKSTLNRQKNNVFLVKS